MPDTRVVVYLGLICCLLAGPWAIAAESHQESLWTPELTLKVKRVGEVRVSPDGGRVAFEVGEAVTEGEKSEWLSHIHIGPADGGPSLQLTRGEHSCSSPRWSPDGRFIAFLSSREKGKNNLWKIRVDGGEAVALTEIKSSISDFAWAPDGASIAVVVTEPESEDEEKARKEKRDARVVDEDLKLSHLHLVELEKDDEGKYPVRQLTSGDFSVGGSFGGGMDWSPDGKSIAYTHVPSPQVDYWTKADISVVDIDSLQVRPLATSDAAESAPLYSPDGKWIAYTASDVPPTWAFTRRVHVVSASGGTPRPLADTHDQQPSLLGWTADGSALLASETHRTVSRILRIPADGSAATDFSPLDTMAGGAAVNHTRTHLGFTSQAWDRAPEAFVSPIGSFAAAQVSHVQDLPPAPLGRTEAVRWKSSDGREIEGLLTYPVGFQPGRRVPLLVIVHGGPTGVFVNSFIATRGAYPISVFAQRGYAVLRCNVRGSSGYGREFRYANYGDWGGGDYRDIMGGVDRVVAMGVADEERLGVMGWSYGGFMTSWIITQTDRFKAASVGAGVTNLMSFTGTADIPGFVPDYFGGEFWEVFDKWRAHSAMFQVGGVTTPTLIQHGENDLRVPVSQGYELYNALKRQNVPVKMVVYPRQPHGIREPKLQLDAIQRNLDWFDHYLKPEPVAEKVTESF